jgi:AcrR family transcriptional regulator
MGLRADKKEEQRQAILATAVALFREHGFEKTRVRDVAERLRISEGTFFNHFASKQSVLEAAALAHLERIAALLQDDALADTRAAAERLEEVVAAFAAAFSGDREFATLLAGHTKFFLGRWSEEQWHEAAYRPLTLLLEDGQRRGEVRADVPPSQLAELYVGVNLITISNWLAGSPGDGTLEGRLLRAWSVFRDGSLTEPVATSSARPFPRSTRRSATGRTTTSSPRA